MLVTSQDHDEGGKTLEVKFRNGTSTQIRLTAPSYRATQKLSVQLQQSRDVICVTAACYPGADAEKFLNSLTLESASLVETAAFALTFGEEFQKKMEALGETLAQSMVSTASAQKLTLLLPDIAPGKSENIHCPNCNCTIALSAPPPCAPTSVESTPAPPAT